MEATTQMGNDKQERTLEEEVQIYREKAAEGHMRAKEIVRKLESHSAEHGISESEVLGILKKPWYKRTNAEEYKMTCVVCRERYQGYGPPGTCKVCGQIPIPKYNRRPPGDPEGCECNAGYWSIKRCENTLCRNYPNGRPTLVRHHRRSPDIFRFDYDGGHV